MKKVLFVILILASFAGRAFAVDLYVGGLLNSPYFFGTFFEAGTGNIIYTRWDGAKIDWGSLAIRADISLFPTLCPAQVLIAGSEIKYVRNIGGFELFDCYFPFRGYGFFGGYVFVPMSTWDVRQKCLEFGVGTECGEDWAFAIEAGFSAEILPEGQENDTGMLIGGISLKKRIN